MKRASQAYPERSRRAQHERLVNRVRVTFCGCLLLGARRAPLQPRHPEPVEG